MSQDTLMQHATNVEDFLTELHCGTFRDKLALILSHAAQGAVTHAGAHCKRAKVTVEFSLSQIGENDQVVVSHKLASIIPTKRGKKIEEDTTETPFFVGKGGQMTINPPKEEDSGQKPFQLQKEQDGKTPLRAVDQ